MARRTSAAHTGKSEAPSRKGANNQRASASSFWPKRRETAAAVNQTTGSRIGSSLILPVPTPISSVERRTQQQARRRRQTARQMRRFDSIVARVQLPHTAVQAPTMPSFRLGQWHPSRIISFLLVLLTIGAIAWVHYDLDWYVYREYVTFNQLTYSEPDELYQLMDVEGWNLFWISPRQVRERLIALPTIADVQVQLRPPHWVAIEIQETVPVARWVTQAGNFWLLPEGTALAQTDDRYDALPQIIDNEGEAVIWGDSSQQRIDPDLLQSALVLLELLPGIDNLYFHNEIGLNFHMPGSDVWVYWGSGANTEQKYQNLQAVRDLLRRDPQGVTVVDLRSERPVLRY